MALLRLPPGADDSFWSAWARLHPASAGTARRNYTAGLAPLSFMPVTGTPPTGPPGSGDPLGFVHVLAALDRPDAGTATPAGSRCWTLLTDLTDPLRDFRRHYGELRQVNTHHDPVVAAWPLLCPWQPELAAAGTLTAARTANLNRLLQLAARIAITTGTPPLPPAVTMLASRGNGTQLTAAARRLAGSCRATAAVRGS